MKEDKSESFGEYFESYQKRFIPLLIISLVAGILVFPLFVFNGVLFSVVVLWRNSPNQNTPKVSMVIMGTLFYLILLYSTSFIESSFENSKMTFIGVATIGGFGISAIFEFAINARIKIINNLIASLYGGLSFAPILFFQDIVPLMISTTLWYNFVGFWLKYDGQISRMHDPRNTEEQPFFENS